jgi:septal ring factor EnvC (AmiA/AmiB activator)
LDTTTINVIFQLLGLFATVSSAAWVLSQRLERLKIMFESHARLMDERMLNIDKDLTELKTSIKESRAGRVELWSELNTLRERTAKIETVVEVVTKSCKGD